jgi:hypothetical protein
VTAITVAGSLLGQDDWHHPPEHIMTAFHKEPTADQRAPAADELRAAELDEASGGSPRMFDLWGAIIRAKNDMLKSIIQNFRV